MLTALLLSLALQDKVRQIDRLDKQKEAYDKAARSCEEAIKLLDSDPETALQKLNDVVDRLDQPDKPGLREYETVIRIEFRAGDPDRPLAFFPFQDRGRVRLKLADSAKGVEDRRKLLAEAVSDLQKSLDRGADSSATFLKAARARLDALPPPPPPVPTAEELAAAWSKEWATIRPKLALAAFPSDDPSLPGKAARLLGRMATEASPRDQVEAAGWITGETAEVASRVKGLARDDARRAVAWAEALSTAVSGVESLKAARLQLAQIRAEAGRIADYRGSFTIKIGPSPYAEEVRVLREGRVIALPARSTPMVLGPLEIGDITIELSHPDAGKRTVTIPASALSEGRTYVLSGRMKGDLSVTPLP
jgi:hypothetical protein